MKRLSLLAALVSLALPCALGWQQASADDYEVNPDAPNGYNASMAAYHYHGSYRAPTEEQNGYAATAARTRFGANPLLVPKSDDEDSGGRWGTGDESSARGSSDDNFWGNHFRNRCQPQGAGGQGSGLSTGGKMAGAALTLGAMQTYRNYREHSAGPAPINARSQVFQQAQNYGGGGGGGAQSYYRQPTEQYEGQYQPQYTNQYQSHYSNQYQNQYQNQFSNQYRNNNTALRRAVSNRPIGTMLKNSQGGFNRIYTDE